MDCWAKQIRYWISSPTNYQRPSLGRFLGWYTSRWYAGRGTKRYGLRITIVIIMLVCIHQRSLRQREKKNRNTAYHPRGKWSRLFTTFPFSKDKQHGWIWAILLVPATLSSECNSSFRLPSGRQTSSGNIPGKGQKYAKIFKGIWKSHSTFWGFPNHSDPKRKKPQGWCPQQTPGLPELDESEGFHRRISFS